MRAGGAGVFLAAAVPPLVVEDLLFTFGQLTPSQGEYEINLAALRSWSLFELFLAAMVTATYTFLTRKRTPLPDDQRA